VETRRVLSGRPCLINILQGLVAEVMKTPAYCWVVRRGEHRATDLRPRIRNPASIMTSATPTTTMYRSISAVLYMAMDLISSALQGLGYVHVGESLLGRR
jgi:hypothetical protein